MRDSLSNNLIRLASLRKSPGLGPGGATRLTALEDFGANPGNLAAWRYIPQTLRPNAPLVVILHGCTQTAAGYDQGAGWSELADRFGFALLFPEQRRANNPNLCFNWFSPADMKRGTGEPASIHAMIRTVVASHDIDSSRIFVTGLSAGGAMANVMLATYPELFAGGAIIAGLPFGSATSVLEATEQMRAPRPGTADALAALVRQASSHIGPRPTVSVWHGSADTIVNVANADASVRQWCAVHQLSAQPSHVETIGGHRRAVWRDQNGRDCVEQFTISGMGHGTPVATQGAEACGVPGPFMLAGAISSSYRIASFWDLLDGDAVQPTAAYADAGRARTVAANANTPPPEPLAQGPGGAIERALRAAGLM